MTQTMKRNLTGLVMMPVLLAQMEVGGNIIRNDAAVDQLVPHDAKLEKIASGFRFVEGPIWMRSGGYLMFSDMMSNAILKWTPNKGAESFRKPIFAGDYPDTVFIGSNGLTVDRQGRLLAAEQGNRRVTRTEKNGSITVLADRYEGKRFNSPNDLVVKRNGDIYFTDPTVLIRSYPQGTTPPVQELDFRGVFRITKGNKVELLVKDIPFPNGLTFSPDEKKLYVSNSRPDKFWMVYEVKSDGSLAGGHKFYDATDVPGANVPDGLKVDQAGNIYATGPAGVTILRPAGKVLGVIQVPELPANVGWGDSDGKTLYITARTSVYRIRLSVAGVRP